MEFVLGLLQASRMQRGVTLPRCWQPTTLEVHVYHAEERTVYVRFLQHLFIYVHARLVPHNSHLAHLFTIWAIP